MSVIKFLAWNVDLCLSVAWCSDGAHDQECLLPLQLWLVHQLWPFLDKQDPSLVTHALVTSSFDYCNTLSVDLWRYCETSEGPECHSPFVTLHQDTLVKEFHWLSIVFCSQLKMLVIPYKALYSLGPSYCQDGFIIHITAWLLNWKGSAFWTYPWYWRHI